MNKTTKERIAYLVELIDCVFILKWYTFADHYVQELDKRIGEKYPLFKPMGYFPIIFLSTIHSGWHPNS